MYKWLTKKLGKAGIFPWLLFFGLMVYARRATASVVRDSVIPGITPTNPENWFYRGVNGVGDIFNDGTDNDNWSLGTWLYDVTRGGGE